MSKISRPSVPLSTLFMAGLEGFQPSSACFGDKCVCVYTKDPYFIKIVSTELNRPPPPNDGASDH